MITSSGERAVTLKAMIVLDKYNMYSLWTLLLGARDLRMGAETS